MSISLIAAIAENNCIGKNGQLPWHIPADMRRFKELTIGKTVLMGRKTWESLPEKFRPLPGRKNVIITRQAEYAVPPGVFVYPSIDAARATHGDTEIMVIGGADIYRQTIDQATTLYITHVHQNVAGDAFFPKIDLQWWQKVDQENHEDFSFITYIHRKS